MKVHHLFERRRQVSAKVGPMPNFTARDVVHKILGDRVTEDGEDGDYGKIFLGRTWSRGAMFSNMDAPPGGGGAIGLENLDGKTPKDIAEAAHEAFHALLQLRSKNHVNEKVVNRLAERWLQDNLDGMFLHQALEHISTSQRGYKSQTYDSSRRWRDEQQDDGF